MAKDEKKSKKKKVVDSKPKGKKGFQPGNTVCKGRASYDREEILAKRLDQATLFRIINLHIFSPPELLEAMIADPNTNIMEVIICRSLLNARYKAEVSTIDYYISRLIGKIPDKVIVSDDNPFKDMTLEEMKAKHAELAKSNRETLNHILKDKKNSDGSGTGDAGF